MAKGFAFSLETGQIIGNFGVDSNGVVRLDRVTSPGDTSFLVSGLWGATSDITTGDYLQAKNYFDPIINPITYDQSDLFVHSRAVVGKPNKYRMKNAEKITNFNPSNDFLGIDTKDFRVNGSASFASGKNKIAKTRLSL